MAIEHDKRNGGESNQISLNDKSRRVLVASWAPGRNLLSAIDLLRVKLDGEASTLLTAELERRVLDDLCSAAAFPTQPPVSYTCTYRSLLARRSLYQHSERSTNGTEHSLSHLSVRKSV